MKRHRGGRRWRGARCAGAYATSIRRTGVGHIARAALPPRAVPRPTHRRAPSGSLIRTRARRRPQKRTLAVPNRRIVRFCGPEAGKCTVRLDPEMRVCTLAAADRVSAHPRQTRRECAVFRDRGGSWSRRCHLRSAFTARNRPAMRARTDYRNAGVRWNRSALTALPTHRPWSTPRSIAERKWIPP